jgi:hypothetical protein
MDTAAGAPCARALMLSVVSFYGLLPVDLRVTAAVSPLNAHLLTSPPTLTGTSWRSVPLPNASRRGGHRPRFAGIGQSQAATVGAARASAV